MQWACPNDRAPLSRENDGELSCPQCDRRFGAASGITVFDEGTEPNAPLLDELWEQVRELGPERAAEEFCRAHGCSRRRFTTDWTFYLPCPEDGVVLELGAGFGDDTVALSGRTSRTIGLVPAGPNARILGRRLAHENRSNVELAVVRDLAHLPLPSACVDAIAIEEAAFPGFGLNRRTLPRAAREWRRVLREDGALLVGAGNSIQRWPGAARLRSALASEARGASLNRTVKRAAAPTSTVGPGAGHLARRLRDAGFGEPTILAPLPNERDISIVVPITNDRVMRYCFNSLLCQNSPFVRAAIAAANVGNRLGLLRHLVPYTFLLFRPGAGDGARG